MAEPSEPSPQPPPSTPGRSSNERFHVPVARPLRDREARGGRYRLTLPRKAMAGALALVMLSVGLCGLLTSRIAVDALRRSVDRDARLLTEAIGRHVAAAMSGGRTVNAGRAIEDLALDRRVAFIAVADASQRTLARRISDAEAWRRYRAAIPDGDLGAAERLNQTRRFDGAGAARDVVVHTQPLWRPRPNAIAGDPHADASARSGLAREQLLGYLMLAMTDDSSARTVTHLRLATIGIVLGIGVLCLPLVVWSVRHLTAPVRRLVMESRRLAAGQEIRLVGLNRGDEIGDLTRAYERMADDLSAARGELIEANAELEQKVRRRTAELDRTNQKLQQQMQEKDDFIRAIMHDLNAPLRNIAGMTRMLLMKHEQALTDEAVTKLKRIAANARRETELLGDLLELSRLRAQPGKSRRTDLNDLMHHIRQALDYDLEQKDITLECAAMPTVVGDPQRLRQVFQNLIENAVKFMPADAPQRRIAVGCTRPAEGEHGEVVFHVRDTGPGIAPRDQQRIFQVFQRARYREDGRTPTETEGRGVGLSTVKAIVETMGGRIWVQSEPDRGATFYFTLTEAAASDATPTRPGSGPTDAETTGCAA